MKDLLKSCGFVVLFWTVTVYYFTILALRRLKGQLSGQPLSSVEAHTVATRWGRAILTLTPGWDIKISGQENLPQDGIPYVIVANHESSTDILAIYFLGVQFRWLSKDAMFRLPFVGRAMKWAGYVPIKRGDRESHQAALRRSAEWLAEKVPMLFFPEGTRSTGGTLAEFKTGAFRLAQEAQVPILPVVLYGAGKLLRKKSICPKKATVYIKILPLVSIGEGEAVQDYTQRVRSMMLIEHGQIEALDPERVASGAPKPGHVHHRGLSRAEDSREFACRDHPSPN